MRFPRFHIATSVVNRILDLADEEMMTAEASAAPQIPDASKEGAELDRALAQPVPAVPAPMGSDDEALLSMQQGDSAAEAIGSMALLESL